MAEFALIAPFVFLLIFGMIEGARVFSAWLIVTNEAREGARVAAVVNGLVADPGAVACDRVLQRATGLLETSRLTCSTQMSWDASGNATSLVLTLRYSVDLVIPISKPLFGSNFVPIAARSVMRPE